MGPWRPGDAPTVRGHRLAEGRRRAGRRPARGGLAPERRTGALPFPPAVGALHACPRGEAARPRGAAGGRVVRRVAG